MSVVKADVRLIEAGFPCHQVGAETQREQSVGLQPPNNRLHVWWARRPLTPSRAAILASFLPANADLDQFLLALGIERVEAIVNNHPWVLSETSELNRIDRDDNNDEYLELDKTVLRWLMAENARRAQNRNLIDELVVGDPSLQRDRVLAQWRTELQPIPEPFPIIGSRLAVRRVPADPAFSSARIQWEDAHKVRTAADKYGYGRAFANSPVITNSTGKIVLDPTAGGGAIPFEAMRLGHTTIANELNPVATVILHATLDYPTRFGPELADDIANWGERLRAAMVEQMKDLFPASPLSGAQLEELKSHLKNHNELVKEYAAEQLDGFLFTRQIICPHCEGEAPLLNSSWLCKEEGDRWGVKIVTDGKKTKGTVTFEPYRVSGGKGPNGEDPDFATVADGVGACIHCRQEIGDDPEGKSEIKLQACGKSRFGMWKDRLYCVVGVRHQPKLDAQGKLQRYKTGDRAGQIKTEKIRYFRSPVTTDQEALAKANVVLKTKWNAWELYFARTLHVSAPKRD